jgi:hypothetical protein
MDRAFWPASESLPTSALCTPTDDYDTVTGRDIAEFLHDYADLRCTPRADDPAERAAFPDRKADLFTSMANQAARGRTASYTDAWIEQVRQMATDARTAANHARLEQLPQQRVGPNRGEPPSANPQPVGPRPRRSPGPHHRHDHEGAVTPAGDMPGRDDHEM